MMTHLIIQRQRTVVEDIDTPSTYYLLRQSEGVADCIGCRDTLLCGTLYACASGSERPERQMARDICSDCAADLIRQSHKTRVQKIRSRKG